MTTLSGWYKEDELKLVKVFSFMRYTYIIMKASKNIFILHGEAIKPSINTKYTVVEDFHITFGKWSQCLACLGFKWKYGIAKCLEY